MTSKLTTSLTLAQETSDMESLREVQANWRDSAKAFWKSMAGDGAPKPLAKLHRLKVLRWLAASWMHLVVATGRGWDQFQVAEDPAQRGDPLTWPSVTVTIDQGSDGWSACFFLASQFLNVIPFFDMSHRVWNDCQLSIQDCGWWHVALLLVGLMNLDHGPWSTQRWFNETKDGVQDYLKLNTRTCPMLQGRRGILRMA